MIQRVLDILLALPPEKQRLARGQYYNPTQECACLLGVLDPGLQTLPYYQQGEGIDVLIEKGVPLEPLYALGLNQEQLIYLQELNDSEVNETPEERYLRVTSEMKRHIKEEQCLP